MEVVSRSLAAELPYGEGVSWVCCCVGLGGVQGMARRDVCCL